MVFHTVPQMEAERICFSCPKQKRLPPERNSKMLLISCFKAFSWRVLPRVRNEPHKEPHTLPKGTDLIWNRMWRGSDLRMRLRKAVDQMFMDLMLTTVKEKVT